MQLQFWGLIAMAILISCQKPGESFRKMQNWADYLGDPSVSHYSQLDQIDTQNVAQLQIVWEYQAGQPDTSNRSQIQCNPLVVNGVLYGTGPSLQLFALNGENGSILWEFDPFEGGFNMFGMGVNRGLSYWEGRSDKRILYACGASLFAVNAESGQLITTFGDSGRVDLRLGLDREIGDLFIVSNTPGIIYENLLILGSRVSESIGHVPGHIRAFDVLTGEIKWVFHTIPHPGEFGYETWPKDAYIRSGGANAWAGFSLDQERGIVYCPTGSASFDFYGGDREGENLFANCIIALNAKTGTRIWHYQTVHHDIWDKDLPAPPNLVTIVKDGQNIDAVAQISKSGYLFVLDRVTGMPIFPIEEVPVPPSDLDGEKAWPTQPVPTVFPPFSRTELTTDDLAIRSPEAKAEAKQIWANSRGGRSFVPLSLEPTVFFPGLDGAGEWGGAAYDPFMGILYTNSNEMPWLLKMGEREPAPAGQMIYTSMCQTCHAKDLHGAEMFGEIPSLAGIGERMSLKEIGDVIRLGQGVMPNFSILDEDQIRAVSEFLVGVESEEDIEDIWPYPYHFAGYSKANLSDGYPLIKPPWGQLTAIDLNHQEIQWQIPLGNHEELSIPGHPVTGTENYGGPVVTSGGLLFIAATADEKIRAFNKRSGELLWEYKLPAGGYATPATYMVGDRQFVVIACGGGKLRTKSGSSYVAFSL